MKRQEACSQRRRYYSQRTSDGKENGGIEMLKGGIVIHLSARAVGQLLLVILIAWILPLILPERL